MTTRRKTKTAAVHDTPDVHVLRAELMRKLSTMLEKWRNCPRTGCKRARACMRTECAAPSLDRPANPESDARAMAMLSLGLKRRLAETEPGQDED